MAASSQTASAGQLEPPSALRERLESTRRAEQEARERTAELEQELLAKLQAEVQRVGHLDRELAAGLDRQEELQQEVSGLEKRLATMRTSFEDANRRAQALEEELAHSAEELAALRDGLASATQRATKLEAESAKHEREAQAAQAERDALQASLDQVRAVLGSPPAAVGSAAAEQPGPGPVIVDVDAHPRARIRPDGRVVELNDAFRELLGYEDAELTGAVWPPTNDRKRLSELRKITRRVLEGKSRDARVETKYVTADGSEAPVAGTLSLVTNDASEPDYLELRLDADAA